MANIDPLAALSSEEMRRLIEERKRQQRAAQLSSSFQSDFHTPLNKQIEQEGVIQARKPFTPPTVNVPTPRKIYPSFQPEGYSAAGDVDIPYSLP